MNDQEFQKLNKQLLKQQAQVSKQRERQSPSKISAVKCSILNGRPSEESKLVEDVESTEQCERCRKADCELITQAKGQYKRLCIECETKRQ